MGGSDPFQNHNFVTENHHSWNVLLLVKNILSGSIVEKKKTTQRERLKPRCTRVHGATPEVELTTAL